MGHVIAFFIFFSSCESLFLFVPPVYSELVNVKFLSDDFPDLLIFPVTGMTKGSAPSKELSDRNIQIGGHRFFAKRVYRANWVADIIVFVKHVDPDPIFILALLGFEICKGLSIRLVFKKTVGIQGYLATQGEKV